MTALPSQEDLLALLRFEPETGKLFWRERGIASVDRRIAGQEALTKCCPRGYRGGKLLYRSVLAHRVIFKMMTGEEPLEIDHIDGNPSNNRWSNLRAADRHENGRNRSRSRNNRSGVTGVSPCGDRWYASIKVNGRSLNLGTFDRLADAASVRKAAEARYGFHRNHGRAAA